LGVSTGSVIKWKHQFLEAGAVRIWQRGAAFSDQVSSPTSKREGSRRKWIASRRSPPSTPKPGPRGPIGRSLRWCASGPVPPWWAGSTWI